MIYVDWGGHKIKLTWIPSDKPTDLEKATSVHGFCFEHGKVVLVHVQGRGYNIPGGHIEQDETPEEALHREALEEGSVRGTITSFVGMIEVSHEENPLYDPDGKYPFIGYQLFFKMNITECLPFSRKNETIARIWVEPSEVPYVINDHELLPIILKEALKK